MAQATINARLNATVKERGDKVLRDNGISTTEAIRGLWSSMARRSADASARSRAVSWGWQPKGRPSATMRFPT